MLEVLVIICTALAACAVALLAVLLLRDRQMPLAAWVRRLEQGQDRSERLLREEMARGRAETARGAQQLRAELTGVVKDWETRQSQTSVL